MRHVYSWISLLQQVDQVTDSSSAHVALDTVWRTLTGGLGAGCRGTGGYRMAVAFPNIWLVGLKREFIESKTARPEARRFRRPEFNMQAVDAAVRRTAAY